LITVTSETISTEFDRLLSYVHAIEQSPEQVK